MVTPAAAGWFGLAGIVITTFGVVIVAMIGRSTRAEARGATAAVEYLSTRLGEVESAHEDCEDRLDDAESHATWADHRIADLENALGLPNARRPTKRRRRGAT